MKVAFDIVKVEIECILMRVSLIRVTKVMNVSSQDIATKDRLCRLERLR